MNLLELLAALAAYLDNSRLGVLVARLVQTTSEDPALRDETAEALTADELAEVAGLLGEATNALLDSDDMSDAVLGHLDAVRQAAAVVAAEEAARESDAADRAARRAELANDIANSLGSADPEDGEDGDGDDGDAGAGEDAEVAGDAGDAAPAVGDGAAAPAPAPVPVPVAAGANLPGPITRVAVRRPDIATPRRPAASQQAVPFTAAASFNGMSPGTRLSGDSQIGELWEEAVRVTKQYRGPRDFAPVMRLEYQLPEDRVLGDNVRANTRMVEAVTGRQALAASGGICAPINVDFSLPVIGTDARPIRDALARFGAEARGSIGTLPPPILGDAAGAVTVWTHANDIAVRLYAEDELNPVPEVASKACLRVTCPDEETTIVDAINTCLEFGNFDLRYFRERADAWQRLVLVEAARAAENKLLEKIRDESTDVTVPRTLDTIRDVLAGLDRATAKYTWLHRDPTIQFRWLAPMVLFKNMRASLVRQMPVGTMEETMALAEAQIARWLQARNINVTWHLDGPVGQGFTPQGDGALQGWPATAETSLFPEGDWLHVDGGRQDFGVVRDSVLNATNDVQVQAEIFENAHHHGRDSWNLDFTIVPDGVYAAPHDITT